MRTAKEILHPNNDWSDAYPELAALIREFLDALAAFITVELTTTELADILWSPSTEDDRSRLFRALKAIAQHDLVDYTTGRRQRRLFGKKRNVVLWASPDYDL